MTQMMLFDSNSLVTNSLATNSLANANPAAPALGPLFGGYLHPSPVDSGFVQNQPASPRPATSPSLPAPAAGEDGVHRMGDLARLVLLRYQLVARRREEMAARRAK